MISHIVALSALTLLLCYVPRVLRGGPPLPLQILIELDGAQCIGVVVHDVLTASVGYKLPAEWLAGLYMCTYTLGINVHLHLLFTMHFLNPHLSESRQPNNLRSL